MDISQRVSIADLYRADKRCGVYVLEFTNGEVYAGQAVDVTRRYIQHRKTHQDICRISFRPIARQNLNEEERSMIWNLERLEFALRNITFTSILQGERDFDLIMPVEEQALWLNNPNYSHPTLERPNDVALRRKYKKKYEQLLTQPFATEAIEITKYYVQNCVPVVSLSEMTFWAVTCLPYSTGGVKVYTRININWQEVFSIFYFYKEGQLEFSWHLALSPLVDEYGESLDAFFAIYPELGGSEHFYEPGGSDQIHLVSFDLDETWRLLENDTFIKAIKLFNLRLMRRGPCTFNRYHCFDLADRLI